MADHTPYWLAERAAADEFERLEQHASLSDPTVRARLTALGLRPGMRCLEVGPGTGSMVRWLVDQGTTVTTLDLDDRYFDKYAAPQVVQRIGDVRTAPLGRDYDFVLTQLLLHHLPERRDVIGRLADSLRPGGWLVVNEPDVRFMWTHTGPDHVVAWFEMILQRFLELGVDYSCGMEIPTLLRDAALLNVDAGLWTPLVAAGTGGCRHYLNALDILRPVVVERGRCTDADVDAVAAEIADDALMASGTPMLLSWGKRAALAA